MRSTTLLTRISGAEAPAVTPIICLPSSHTGPISYAPFDQVAIDTERHGNFLEPP
jgi:hypothetical protein